MRFSIHHSRSEGLLTEFKHTVDAQNVRVLLALASRRNFQPATDQQPETGSHRSSSERSGGGGAGIPEVIYQTWKPEALPDNYEHWRRTIARLNPGFETLLWSDQENREFVREYFPGLLDLYDGYPREIFRVDLVRPLFLLQFGGYYFDLDCEAVNPIDERWSSRSVVLGRMGDHDDFEHSLPNATMASTPGQMFWLVYTGYIIDATRRTPPEQLDRTGPETITGPIALWRTFALWQSMTAEQRAERARTVAEEVGARRLPPLQLGDVYVAPKDEMFALDWNNRVHQRLIRYMRSEEKVLTPSAARRLFPRAITATYWSHTW